MTNKSDEKRNEILLKLSNGEYTIEEADRLLEEVEIDEDNTEDIEVGTIFPASNSSIPDPDESETPPDSSRVEAAVPPEFRKFKWVWTWFLVSGLVLTLLGGFGMYNGYENAGLGWGFWLSWIPLLLGVIVTTLALATSNAMWVHVRVNTGQDEWPRRIAISLPLPMFLLRFGMRMGKLDLDGIGKFGSEDVDALLKAIQESDVPLTVHVDEGGGEKVEVYIGR